MSPSDIDIFIPDDADAVYLGNYRFGIDQYKEGSYVSPPPIQEYSEDIELCRVYNMLGAHAVIYKSKKYKEEVIRLFRDVKDTNNNDVILARNLAKFMVYTYKNPIFFQDQRFSNHNMQWCTYFNL